MYYYYSPNNVKNDGNIILFLNEDIKTSIAGRNPRETKNILGLV